MGNISRVSSKKNLTPKGVTAQLHEINERRFGGYFRIEVITQGLDEDSTAWWGFSEPDGDSPLWGFWLSESRRRIEGKHPRPGWHWCYWAWATFQNDLGASWSGRISDEGVEETWAPVKDKWPTLQDYLTSTMEGLPPDIMQKSIQHSFSRLPSALEKYAK